MGHKTGASRHKGKSRGIFRDAARDQGAFPMITLKGVLREIMRTPDSVSFSSRVRLAKSCCHRTCVDLPLTAKKSVCVRMALTDNLRNLIIFLMMNIYIYVHSLNGTNLLKTNTFGELPDFRGDGGDVGDGDGDGGGGDGGGDGGDGGDSGDGVCVCMCVFVDVYVCVCRCVCLHMCTCLCVCGRESVRMRVCMHILCACMCVSMHVRMNVCMHHQNF